MSATTPARPLRTLPTALVAAGAFALAIEDGSAQLTSRSVAAILSLWAILLAAGFGLWPRSRPPRAAIVCGALLLGFTLLAGLSALWAPAAERAFVEFDRAALYAALFVVTVLATRHGDARRWVDGLALAIGVVGMLALGQRLLPGVLPEGDIPRLLPAAATRLSYPLGYWNGLAIFLALGVPLLLRLAASHAGPLVRGLAVAPLPALAAAVYLTSSRGGVAVAAIAVLVFLALTARRFAVVQALVVAGVGSAVAIAVLRSQPALVDGLPGTPAAEDAGPGVAVIVALTCLLSGALHALVAAVAPPRLVLARPAVIALAAIVVAAAGVGLAAGDPADRFRTFKQPPPQEVERSGFVQDHLLSSTGSGRWQFWDAAVDQFREHPVAGEGAGTYEAWWAQHGTLDWFARNAHSLWLETLGELGLMGLLLLAGAFAAALASGAARIGGASHEDRTVVAALLAVVAAFVVGAGIDWIWQIPAIAAIGVVALGLLTGPATARAVRGGTERPLRFAARAAVVLMAWVAILAAAIPLLVSNEITASREASSRGDLEAAEEHAASARAIQPWAATPHLQLALVREEMGDVERSRRHIAAAIERDASDWRLRLVAARLATKGGDIPAARAALRAARRLNPRSPALRRSG